MGYLYVDHRMNYCIAHIIANAGNYNLILMPHALLSIRNHLDRMKAVFNELPAEMIPIITISSSAYFAVNVCFETPMTRVTLDIIFDNYGQSHISTKWEHKNGPPDPISDPERPFHISTCTGEAMKQNLTLDYWRSLLNYIVSYEKTWNGTPTSII